MNMPAAVTISHTPPLIWTHRLSITTRRLKRHHGRLGSMTVCLQRYQHHYISFTELSEFEHAHQAITVHIYILIIARILLKGICSQRTAILRYKFIHKWFVFYAYPEANATKDISYSLSCPDGWGFVGDTNFSYSWTISLKVKASTGRSFTFWQHLGQDQAFLVLWGSNHWTIQRAQNTWLQFGNLDIKSKLCVVLTHYDSRVRIFKCFLAYITEHQLHEGGLCVPLIFNRWSYYKSENCLNFNFSVEFCVACLYLVHRHDWWQSKSWSEVKTQHVSICAEF